MIGRLLAIMFLSRELAHRMHLKTGSYAEHGVLSVAYGNAALVACVKLAEEVVALRARVEELERGE